MDIDYARGHAYGDADDYFPPDLPATIGSVIPASA